MEKIQNAAPTGKIVEKSDALKAQELAKRRKARRLRLAALKRAQAKQAKAQKQQKVDSGELQFQLATKEKSSKMVFTLQKGHSDYVQRLLVQEYQVAHQVGANAVRSEVLKKNADFFANKIQKKLGLKFPKKYSA